MNKANLGIITTFELFGGSIKSRLHDVVRGSEELQRRDAPHQAERRGQRADQHLARETGGCGSMEAFIRCRAAKNGYAALVIVS